MATEFIRPDEGLFAPDSVARRVWSYPTSALLGFIRAVTIEHLDPDLTAAVDASGQVLSRPALRYDRTVRGRGIGDQVLGHPHEGARSRARAQSGDGRTFRFQ